VNIGGGSDFVLRGCLCTAVLQPLREHHASARGDRGRPWEDQNPMEGGPDGEKIKLRKHYLRRVRTAGKASEGSVKE